MEKEPIFMNLMTDFAFKRLFGSPKRKHILIRFLNILLGKDGMTVYDVKYHDKEVLPEDAGGKRIVYDVYCTTPGEKEHIVVEMQQVYHPYFESRAVYYAIKGLVGQVKRGDSYGDVSPVYAIFLLGFDLRNLSPKILREVQLTDIESHEKFSDLLHMIFVSLQQTRKSWRECESDFDKIMYLIKNMHTMDKNSEAYKSKEYDDLFHEAEIGRMACEDIVAYSQSNLKLKEIQESFEWSYADGFSEGERKGRLEGIEKGIEKGREEGMAIALRRTAIEMLKRDMTQEMVHQFVGLPKEEIEALYRSIHSK